MNQASQINAPGPQDDQPITDADGSGAETNRKQQTRLRFGLLELLLLIAAVASWLPVWIARQEIPKLKAEIETMRLSSLELIVTDPAQLNARILPSISSDVSSWKYFAPDDAALDLRLATQGINSLEPPSEFESCALPTGEHTVHVEFKSDAKGYHALVYLDDDLVLQQHHPKDWVKSGSSSSSGGVSAQSSVYPVGETLTLVNRKISQWHPLHGRNTLTMPVGYDGKGTCVWIAPRHDAVEVASNFQLKTNGFAGSAFGHRQGMRVQHLQAKGRIGLLSIEPSWYATLGENRWGSNYTPVAISVRPLVAGAAQPEVPELQAPTDVPSETGLTITIRETLDESADAKPRPPSSLSPVDAIGDDPMTMHLFAHYPAFASGAKPIVEILFDAKHPNRIGFLPHAAPGSAEMEAIEFVTQFDAKFLWRQVELSSGDKESAEADAPHLVPLANFYPEHDFRNLATAEQTEPMELPWQTVSLDELPQVQSVQDERNRRQLTLRTDVKDSTKLTFPLGLPQQWEYEGVPNLQRWVLPVSQGVTGDQQAAKRPTVEVRAVVNYPGTQFATPGGPVIGNVRITLPMPVTEPVWYEIISDM